MDNDNLPFNRNINWVQLVAALATVLVMFGINLDAPTQAAIVSLILAGNVFVTWVLHTFVNHPENAKAAKKMAASAVAAAKGNAGSLAALFVVCIGLAGCGTVAGDYFANPRNDVQVARSAFQVALGLYNTVCNANGTASFCSADNMEKAAKLEQAVQDALSLVDNMLTPDGKLSVSMASFETDLNLAWKAEGEFSDFVNSLNAQKTQAMLMRAKAGALPKLNK